VTAPRVRTVTDDELADVLTVVRMAFLSPPPSPEALAVSRRLIDVSRCLGAWDAEGRLCGMARAFPTPLTVPGGEVPAAAVSAVGVLPTHRRQGHLTRMMHAQLADVADRGEPVAVLVAAEYPIYGRFGYGPATEPAVLRIDADAAVWRDEPTGTVELVDAETFAKVADELYERARRAKPGHIGWDTARWRITAGVDPAHDGQDDARRHAPKALWRDPAGEVQGATTYRVDESWERNRPANTLRAEFVLAATDRAEHELLRFLAEIDWIRQVQVGLRPQDDPASLALVDGRAAVLSDRSDHLWLRVLDVPAALTARRYAAAGSLVLGIDDPLGHAAGRFRLEAGPDGATCTPTDAGPDLVVPAGALGSAYLGGQTWARLAAAGWVDEHTPGAVERASALFATPRAPWCPVTF
jgi:predicted acetyltransferase